MADMVPITVEGFAKLKERLKYLKEFERPKNIRDIEEARAHGDLSENAEYHAAKERQSMLDVQMRETEDRIARAQVIDPSTLTGDKVVFGATVLLLDLSTDDEVTYQIVGVDEADPKASKVSISSPIARALIGKRRGDEVTVRAPGGDREYEIVDVIFR
ncbi:MAG: transcription elongation factor GreA [Myxococcales bacterium]